MAKTSSKWRWKKLLNRPILVQHIKRWSPWVSLILGIVSGFIMSRGYEQSFQFGASLFAFVIFLSITRTIFSLQKSNPLVDFASITATQIFVQYILLFLVPFAYFKGSWGWGIILLLLTASTLWDPFWARILRNGAFRFVLRYITYGLSFYFIYPIFFPRFLQFIDVVFVLGSAVILFPWFHVLRKKPLHWPQQTGFWVGLGYSIVLPFLPAFFHFPVLSLWIKEPQWTLSGGAANGAPTSKSPPRVCAQARIVAPQGVVEPVHAVWFWNGQVLDDITLPPIQGNLTGRGFATKTCKSAFDQERYYKEDIHKLSVCFYLKDIFIACDKFSTPAEK